MTGYRLRQRMLQVLSRLTSFKVSLPRTQTCLTLSWPHQEELHSKARQANNRSLALSSEYLATLKTARSRLRQASPQVMRLLASERPYKSEVLSANTVSYINGRRAMCVNKTLSTCVISASWTRLSNPCHSCLCHVLPTRCTLTFTMPSMTFQAASKNSKDSIQLRGREI